MSNPAFITETLAPSAALIPFRTKAEPPQVSVDTVQGQEFSPSFRSPASKRGIVGRGANTGLPKRPTPDRSRYLSFRQVADVVNAAAFAADQGQPLNVQITLTWRCIPRIGDEEVPQLQAQLLNRFGKWLSRRGVVLRFIWTRERVRGKGLHTHLQLHLPLTNPKPKKLKLQASKTKTEKAWMKPPKEKPTFAKEAAAFLAKSGGFVDIGHLKGVWFERGSGTRRACAGSLKYLCKGMDHRDFVYSANGETENLGALVGIEHRGFQGIIQMKRAGVSENIGRKTRAAAGWREVSDPLAIGKIINRENLYARRI